MSAQPPIDLIQPSQEKVSPVVVKIKETRKAHYDFVKAHEAWKRKADIAKDLDAEIPEEPQRSPEAIEGLESIDLQLQAQSEFTRALMETFEANRKRGSNGRGREEEQSDRTPVEALIEKAKNTFETTPEKQLAQVMGMTQSVIEHIHEEAFKDLAALLKISPEVLQFAPSLVTDIKEKYTDYRRRNPHFLQDQSLHEVLKIVLEAGNLKSEEREEIQFLLTEGRAARGMDALFKRAQSQVGYGAPLVNMEAAEVALQLTDEEVRRISRQGYSGDVVVDALLTEYAKIAAEPNQADTLTQQAKLLGMMQSYYQHRPFIPEYGNERKPHLTDGLVCITPWQKLL